MAKKKKKKWIKGAIKKKGALRRTAKKAGALKDGISKTWLRKKKAQLQKKAKGKKKLTAQQLKTLKRINLALTLKRF